MNLLQSPLDITAFIVFAICWIGYDIFARKHSTDRASLLTVMNPLRERWFEQTLTRENRIVDTALTANLLNSATFFSSTTVFALGGLLALFGSIEQSTKVIESLPFAKGATQQWEHPFLVKKRPLHQYQKQKMICLLPGYF